VVALNRERRGAVSVVPLTSPGTCGAALQDRY